MIRVTLEIGKLSGVMPDAIAFCFEIVAAGTPLAGAALDIRAIDGRARRRDCGEEFAAETLFAPCPCGSRHSELLAGEGLNLLPHVDFGVERAIANSREVNPAIEVLALSARSGEGLAAWYDWMRREAAAVRNAALPA